MTRKQKWSPARERAAMNEILECICILARQSNNYSAALLTQISVADRAIKACAALRKEGK